MIKTKIQQELQVATQQNLAPFPADMEIETVEFFDQNGLMGGYTPLGIFHTTRPDSHVFEFIALYINGVLAYYLERPGKNETILFNLVQNLKNRGILDLIGG